MESIKSFTSLEQSRKLAEILPLESADQTWARIAIAGANIDVPEELQYRHNGDMPFQYYSGIGIPCWSLASLLSVLPFPVLYMEMVAGMIFWCCECHFIETDEVVKIEHYDNPVDACVAMVEKLHELKLL